MQQVVTNSTVNGVLQSLFALPRRRRGGQRGRRHRPALRAGQLPTTEEPAVPSALVEPAGIVVTARERAELDRLRAEIGAER